MRQRRAQLGDALEALGAEAQASRRFWSEMSWKIAVAVRPVPTSSCSVYVVVTPTGKRLATLETIASPRVVRIFDSAARRTASRELRRDACRSTSRIGSPMSIDELDAEQLLGHRIGVEQPALDVDRDDAAADVAEDVFGLETRLLERGDELVASLRRSRAARALR